MYYVNIARAKRCEAEEIILGNAFEKKARELKIKMNVSEKPPTQLSFFSEGNTLVVYSFVCKEDTYECREECSELLDFIVKECRALGLSVAHQVYMNDSEPFIGAQLSQINKECEAMIASFTNKMCHDDTKERAAG